MTLSISITIETDGPLTDLENAVLAALSGVKPGTVELTAVDPLQSSTVHPSQADPEPVAEEPVKRTRRTKAEMEAARAAEEAPKVEDLPPAPKDADTFDGGDALADAEDPLAGSRVPAATLEDAVKLATTMVSAGRVGEIKTFLAETGVKRVSELKGEGIAAFVARFGS